MKNAMRGELNNYNQTGHDTSTYGWNSFQKTLGCCGVESYKDWNGTYFDNTTGKVHISRIRSEVQWPYCARSPDMQH